MMTGPRLADFHGSVLTNGVGSTMQSIEELLKEVEKRMSPRHKGVQVQIIWRGLELAVMHSRETFVTGVMMQTHENLLRVAVCINERAIDAWIDGLIEIQENNR